jgi:hypothetical protein
LCHIALNNVGQVLFPVVDDLFVHSIAFSRQQTELYIVALTKRLQQPFDALKSFKPMLAATYRALVCKIGLETRMFQQ